MGDKEKVELDRSQVKKAVLALQAFLKNKLTGKKLFTDESQKISLLFTLWRIPKREQTIQIPLPHGQRTASEDVCLFTRDEPQMTTDQTERFYKTLMRERGIKNVTEIIPFKVLKTEYKSFEAKRRLLGNFDMFLSDNRIRRRLPSHIGKHFYERKKEPLCVNLQSKDLARDLQKLVQGTSVKVNNKGSCCMARVGHSGMNAEELTDNIEVAVQMVAKNIRMKGPVLKLVHLKSEKSVALPIYTSDLSHLMKPEATEAEKATTEKTPENTKQTSAADGKDKRKKRKVEENNDNAGEKEEDEEIPQLVPIVTESKKLKLQRKKNMPAKKNVSTMVKRTKKATTPKGKLHKVK
ncbi:ribosomal L1 domain-containing protein 1 isoform X2 [Syngnathoides biaculeatus]|uniref:ribosomal L1 domain-containing protein 1 isoform X2 n=1 Tax=Syngnathoides biaculeatus TaxID=300417 RepID=UPI002ADD41D6|nr:ribosomal L1 domain-containing protein 1 isoform X2 [Syngnathoides biaculeatus]